MTPHRSAPLYFTSEAKVAGFRLACTLTLAIAACSTTANAVAGKLTGPAPTSSADSDKVAPVFDVLGQIRNADGSFTISGRVADNRQVSGMLAKELPDGARYVATLNGSRTAATFVIQVPPRKSSNHLLYVIAFDETGNQSRQTITLPISAPPTPTPIPPSIPPATPVPPPAPTPTPSPAGAPMLANCAVFPASSVFNTRIDDLVRFPAHPQSAAWISSVGPSRALHMDLGRSEDQADYQNYYGIPYNVVDGTAATTSWPSVSFTITDPRAGNGDGVPDESDCASSDGNHTPARCDTLPPKRALFPYPPDSRIKAEFGACNDANLCGDRHVLVVEQGACRLWESYFTYKVSNQWYAYSTAEWNLNSNQMRPSGWTSGDAAGLPMLPLLMRADEALSGEVRHAFRITFADNVLARAYVWPARHAAGLATANGIPFGAVLRLKSDFPIPANWTSQARAIASAMKRYGVYVADIGSNGFMSGEPSMQWSQDTISQLQRISMSSLEFVDMRSITTHPRFDANSFQATW